ncbi:MAG: GNAT family N-acetyltransferase [Hamadaea sp.]|nr:GNAT family N-acetyltransferase [Hamadaea sp.]
MTATLRPAESYADAVAFTDLRTLVTPYQVYTPERIHHIWQVTPAHAYAQKLVAEVDGQIVAAGRASFNTWTSEEGVASLTVMVHPDHRRRGIGAQLHRELTDHLLGHGARKIEAWGEDETDVPGFAERRGYERTFELRYSKLDLTDLAALPPIPDVAPGVTAVAFSAVEPEAVFAVDAASVVDEPGNSAADALDYEEWRTGVWDSPSIDKEASTLVLVDGVPAAYTNVEVDRRTRRMWSNGTGVLREHRGKGLAKLAKAVAVRRAAERGVTAAYTSNDEVNKPMLAVNTWLGYQYAATQYSYLRTVNPA